jgi:hypothetical protein
MLRFPHLLLALFLHALCAQTACLTDDAGENVSDALLVERARVLFNDAGQHLALSIAVISRQPRGHLDRSNFTGHGGTLVEQAKQFGIERVNLVAPVVERFFADNGLVVNFLIHAGKALLKAKTATLWGSRLAVIYDD